MATEPDKRYNKSRKSTYFKVWSLVKIRTDQVKTIHPLTISR